MTGSLKPGDELVVTKWIGLEGSARLACEKGDHLRKHLPESMVDRAEHFYEMIGTDVEEGIAESVGATAVMEAGEGGIFGALWDIGAASDVGFEVDLNSIPIRQETIEICEVFDINPYLLKSGGMLLLGTRTGVLLKDRLESAGIHATVIGYVTDKADRVVKNGDSRRFLEPRHPDELDKVLGTEV